MDKLLRRRPWLALLGFFPPFYVLGLIFYLILTVAMWLLSLLGDKSWLDLTFKLIPTLGRTLVWPAYLYSRYADPNAPLYPTKLSREQRLVLALQEANYTTDGAEELDPSDHLYGRKVADTMSGAIYLAQNRCLYRQAGLRLKRVTPRDVRRLSATEFEQLLDGLK